MLLTQCRRICSAKLVLELLGFQPWIARLRAGPRRLSFVGHIPNRLDFFAEYGVVSAADENTRDLLVGDESLPTKLHDSFLKCRMSSGNALLCSTLATLAITYNFLLPWETAEIITMAYTGSFPSVGLKV